MKISFDGSFEVTFDKDKLNELKELINSFCLKSYKHVPKFSFKNEKFYIKTDFGFKRCNFNHLKRNNIIKIHNNKKIFICITNAISISFGKIKVRELKY